MRNALKRLAVVLWLACAAGPAFAQSTINTSVPAPNAPLQSEPIRHNFLLAASDINGLLGMHATASLGGCPSTTFTGTDCLVTGSSPAVWYKSYPGGYGEIGTFNTTTGAFTPSVGGTILAPFVGATASLNGVQGLVPAPLLGQQVALLYGSGAWAIPIDIWLGIGDSNAVGQGNSASSPTVQPGMAFAYCANGTIVAANDPTCSAVTAADNANTGGMWPALVNAYGRRIGLVLTGVSGSTQSSAADLGIGNGNWQSTSPGGNYANSLTALNAALAAFTAAGYAPTFRGIIYVLGNNDALQIDNSVITVSQYTSALTAMVANYRAATIGGTTYPRLQFWMPIIGTSLSASDIGYSQVRAAQLTFAAADGNVSVPFTDMFSFASRGLMNAGAHPMQAGYNIMGTAIGSALVPAVAANIPYQLFSANAGIGGTAPPGTVVQIVGADNSQAVLSIDGYGTGSLGVIELRHAAGTLQAPTATQNGDVIAIYGAQSYGTDTFGTTNQGGLIFSATQNHTDTAKGTQGCIYTTANGAATPTCRLTVGQDGMISALALTLTGAALSSPTSGQASFGGNSSFGAIIIGNGTNDVTLENRNGANVCNIGGNTTTFSCNLLALTNPLTVSNGGLGLATLTAHAVLLGEGTNNVAFATIGTAGRLLIDQGAADPAFVAMNGDASITSAGLINVVAVNGATYPGGALTSNTVPVVTGAHAVTYEAVPNAALANSTISGVALGGSLAVLSYGTHLTNSAGASSYNGSAVSTLATDATNANTASTIVARDGSGNFTAGTITASLTGHASLDLALTGGTMAGNIAMGGNSLTGAMAFNGVQTIQSGGNIGFGTETNPQNAFVFSKNVTTGLTPTTGLTASNIWLIGVDGNSPGYDVFAYGGVGLNNFYRADGTAATQTAVVSTDLIGGFGFSGYSGTGTTYNSGAAILVTATETFSAGHNGAYMQLLASGNGVARAQVMRLQLGAIIGTGTTDPGVDAALLTPQAFASLTACGSTLEGALAEVNNSNTATWGATIAGGGSNKVLAHCNGTNWTVAGD